MGTKMVLLVSFFILLSACGQEPYKGRGWPDIFSPQVQAFKDEAVAHGRVIPAEYWTALTVEIGDPNVACQGTGVAGCCARRPDGSRTVTIHPGYWKHGDDGDKYSIIFHELGHCLLDREHKEDIDPLTNKPASIMYPSLPRSAWFENHINYYSDELFSN